MTLYLDLLGLIDRCRTRRTVGLIRHHYTRSARP